MSEVSVALSTGSDGVVHGFRDATDGVASGPLCGAKTLAVRRPNDDDSCCAACLPLIAAELAIDAAEFMAEVTTTGGES